MIFLFISLFTSCEDSVNQPTNEKTKFNKVVELNIDEYISIAYDTPKELTESNIVEIVNTFISSKAKMRSLNSTKSNTAVIDIESKTYVSNGGTTKSESENGTIFSIPLYTVKINNNGSNDIALVAGDERIPYVLAYYGAKEENEAILDENNISNEILIEYSKHLLFQELEYIEKLKDSLRTSTISKIATELNLSPEQVNFDDIKGQIVIENQQTTTKSNMITDPSSINGRVVGFAGPWCDVKWDVGMPYNRTMPQSCPNNWLWDNRYAISSVVVATAQILAYFEPNMYVYGQLIDWEYLKENEEIFERSDYLGSYVADPLKKRNMVANLMKYIGEQCDVDYYCSGATVNFKNVQNFLKRYGITIDGKQDLCVTKMIESIDNIAPIMMYGQTSTGGGHWWLIDGMLVTQERIKTRRGTTITQTSHYAHANMGMGKAYCGYYYVRPGRIVYRPTFNPSFAHFEKNIVMYPNIRNY